MTVQHRALKVGVSGGGQGQKWVQTVLLCSDHCRDERLRVPETCACNSITPTVPHPSSHRFSLRGSPKRGVSVTEETETSVDLKSALCAGLGFLGDGVLRRRPPVTGGPGHTPLLSPAVITISCLGGRSPSLVLPCHMQCGGPTISDPLPQRQSYMCCPRPSLPISPHSPSLLPRTISNPSEVGGASLVAVCPVPTLLLVTEGCRSPDTLRSGGRSQPLIPTMASCQDGWATCFLGGLCSDFLWPPPSADPVPRSAPRLALSQGLS